MSDDRPILDQINLVTGDLAASVEFYRKLGVEIPDTRPGWNEHHRTAQFGADEVVDFDIDSAGFTAHWGSEAIAAGPLLSFRFETRAAVDSRYAELVAAGYRGLREPYDAFFGSRFAVVEDPGGVAVGLMSTPSDDHRSSPPDVAEFR